MNLRDFVMIRFDVKIPGMTRTIRPWVTAGLPAGAYDAITDGLPASRLWSLLLEVAEARAAARRPADLMEQWDRDRFVQPAIVDQRSLVEVDRHLLAAASAFESMELSPVAPLGVCSVMGLTSQNKVLSALRGTEVVSDPTNVLALECARRLRRDQDAFPGRRITVFATEAKAELGDRIVAMIGQPAVARARLEHAYYNSGLRFQVAAQSSDGIEIPIADGGAFDWVAKLTSNRRAVYVASGLGSQLVPLMFRV